MAELDLEPLIFGPYAPKVDGGVQAADIAVARGVSALLAYNDLVRSLGSRAAASRFRRG
jgi:hypothetical protein